MAFVETNNPDILSLQGLHLYHFGLSNCAQRVRLALEEKQLPWTSHYVDLSKFEHLKEEYQSIHPNGVVPALVHDGKLVIESLDIIQYLDEQYSQHPLMPGSEREKSAVNTWMQLAGGEERVVKTLTYERIFRPRRNPTEKDLEFYAQHQRNPDLVRFHADYIHGFGAERLEQCEQSFVTFLTKLDHATASQDYLAGEAFSLADIAIAPMVHRARLLQIDMQSMPNLGRWYERIRSRPSFERAITSFEG